MINVIILGAAGRMGSTIARLAEEDPEIKIAGLVERPGHPIVNSNLYGCIISDSLSDVIEKGDVVIDFTSKDTLIKHIDIAKEGKKAMVIGTTGLSSNQMADIKEGAKYIPILYSSNMSFGMNVIFKILPHISKLLSEFDIEIIEAHHKQKVDAPSGTAKKLFEILKASSGKDKIDIKSIRAGDIVGDHTILFASFGERIELTHRATSRDVFAYGALKAAKFIFNKEPYLYSIFDIL